MSQKPEQYTSCHFKESFCFTAHQVIHQAADTSISWMHFILTQSSALLNFQTPPWHTAHIRILASVPYPPSTRLPVHLTSLLLQQYHSNQSMQISFTKRATIYRLLSYRNQPLNSEYTFYSGASYPP